MDIPSSVLNHPFELAPVLIPGWVTELRPVGIAYAGIPHSLFGTGGLQCVISAWTELKSGAWTMAAYDRVDLYVNDVLIPGAGITVQPGQENEDFYPLYLPQGKLREGVNKLHYKVTRFSGNSDVSNPIDVLYHLRAPGEPAPEGLDLVIPPDVISDGVSAERAAQGVEFGFTYSNRRDYDRINFLVGNVTVPFEMLAGSVPVTHTLFTDTFKQAGDNPKTPLQFTVTDQLGNSNTSSIEYLDIHLDRVLIVPTLTSVKDATGKEIPDAGETTSTTLTLSGQASNGKEVEIYDGSGASAVSKGRATADATTGLWSINITVPAGNRRLYAKSLYHPGNVYSNVRILTVLAPILDFGSDYSQAATEYFIVRGRPPLMPPNDATATYTRLPTGGVSPYGYSSSDENVAIVDTSSGLVRATGNGVARITATDARGNTASYKITISNVKWVERVDGMWWNDPDKRPRPDLHLSLEQMKRFWAIYYPSEGPVATALGWPTGWYWTSTNVETNENAWAVQLDSQGPTETAHHGSTFYPGIKKL